MTATSHRTLTSAAEIAAYLHRLRMAILGVLREGPATGSQIAAKLGVHPANLTRHIRALLDARLISLVEKRDTGRNLEKYYGSVATSFDVAPDANRLRAPHKIGLAFARSDLSAALGTLLDDEARPVVALVASARLSPSDLDRFRTALAALVKSFSAASTKKGESYHINLCLYPGGAEPEDSRRITLTKRRKHK